MTDDDIREVALKRIKSRRDFWYMIGSFVIAIAICIGIWATTGMHYFWPLWPILGMVIATFFTALSTFGPHSRPISQDRIDDEVRRLGGDPRA